MSKLPNQDINSAKDTISNALIREALSVAASRGLNIVNIANKAGISAELLTSTKARVPVNQSAQLWVELAKSMNDEFLGILIQCAEEVIKYWRNLLLVRIH